MEYIDSLIVKINCNHKHAITDEEYSAYLNRYKNYYNSEVEPRPKAGFFANWSWDSARLEEFNRAVALLKIMVQTRPAAPLHPYELKKAGLKGFKNFKKK